MTDDPTRHLPRAQHVPLIAASLRRAADLIERRGADALIAKTVLDDIERPDRRRLELVPTSDGEGHDGDGGGAPRSPTEAAALESKWLTGKQVELRFLLEWLDLNAAEASAIIDEIIRNVDPAVTAAATRQHRELVSSSCCEPKCEDPAEAGCSMRCRECFEWRETWRMNNGWQPPPPVPERVIDDRIRLRMNAKVWVSGPMAGEVL